MPSLQDHLTDARRRLIEAGVDAAEAALDAEMLARDLLGWDRAHLLVHRNDTAPDGFDAGYAARLQRRLRREPVGYILGHHQFWGLDLEVTPDVLIPRPETELIIDEAIRAAASRDPYRRIADVGTGSGCIAVALAVEFPSAEVLATDISGAALAVAARNARLHQVDNRITFLESDLLDGIGTPADLIVSNPPYVAASDAPGLAPELGYEPSQALFAGSDGLSVVGRLLTAAGPLLAANGLLIVEFGFGQEPAVRTLAEAGGWSVEVRRDLQSIPRVAVLRR